MRRLLPGRGEQRRPIPLRDQGDHGRGGRRRLAGCRRAPLEGEWDIEGNFHTLEWRLRKEGRDCKYYSEEGCRIYKARPLLCQTYPFYLEEGRLRWSDCRGLGGEIGFEEAQKIADLLKRRQIVEIKEAIDLIRKYEDFERGEPSPYGMCIVHDSEGVHEIEWSKIPGALGRRLRRSGSR